MGSVRTSILEDLDAYPANATRTPTTPSTAKSPQCRTPLDQSDECPPFSREPRILDGGEKRAALRGRLNEPCTGVKFRPEMLRVGLPCGSVIRDPSHSDLLLLFDLTTFTL
ncbi:hypothetical protein, partial [Microbacterium gubbeenense]|uniref:hypothetical protein n=1 Tax=Microbacterium gubbeenense TaxID=159896 RepID=UPI001B7FB294